MDHERLKEREHKLPQATPPAANYLPFVRTGNLVFVSGQLPKENGEYRYIGKLGREFDLSEGKQAARLCALNVLAQLRAAVEGRWEKVVRCVRVGGYVNATDGFTAHSQVIDGASDALVEWLGEAGRHARVAVGTSGLPHGTAVEVEAVFEVRP